MKLPTIRKQKNGRRRRGRGISVWNLLTGKWGKQHRLPAHVTGEADWEVEVPQIRMSRAFAVMLVLHVVAVGGLFAFRIWGKDDAQKTDAPPAHVSDVPTAITAPEPATAPEIPPVSEEPVATTKAEPAKTYVWHSGDSLPLVAARFGVSSSALREANPDKALVPGAELVVPRSGRVIGGADSGPVEGQPSEIFDPVTKSGTPAEPRPPKAEVVPELALGSQIPDVLPSHDEELAEPKARPISTTTPTKNTPVKPKEGSTVVKTKPAAPVTPAVTTPTPARAAGQRVHVVTKNDTVYSLARKYGFTAEEIAKANGLDANYSIKLGQQLRVPVKR